VGYGELFIKETMKYFSLFSGIGGFELGIGSRGECVGYSEVDKYAIQIYEKNFPNHKNYGDITKIKPSTLPDFDLLVGGFPCQAFSIAGKRGGFNDTRGTLFFGIAKIAKVKRPSLLLIENVKGLLSHDGGRTFDTIIRTLDELGYDLQWQVLNSKNFGVPQNRERIFIVGHLRGTSRPQVFPIQESSESHLIYSAGVVSAREKWLKGGKNLSREFSQGQRIYDSKGISQTLAGNAGGQGGKTGLYAMQWRRTDKGKKARSKNQKEGRDYTPFSGGHRELVPKEGKTVGAITAQAVAKDSLLGNETQIRRLTPTECERLQGFPDGWTEGVSDTQRYKTLGNAVTVNVIEAVVSKMWG